MLFFTLNDNKLSDLLVPGEIHTVLVHDHTWILDFITRDQFVICPKQKQSFKALGSNKCILLSIMLIFV